MLFISIRSSTVENVPKVLRVVEEIKWFRHKAGMWRSTQVFAIWCSSVAQVWTKKGNCIST